MSAALSVLAVTLLAGCSWSMGTLALLRVPSPELRFHERLALRLIAGLGLTSLLLSIAALTGWFRFASAALAAVAALGAVRWAMGGGRPFHQAPTDACTPRRVHAASVGLWSAAFLACIGALAPVTDDDALAYVVPIARHIATADAIRVWTDQARSMWPQSQHVLLAYVLQAGGDRVGLVTACEWLLCVGALSALARRVCTRAEHVVPAIIIALGAPVLAFQVSSAKEDLLLLAATTATAFCLAGSGTVAELAAAGMFAGIAAGAKYSGLFVVLAASASPLAFSRERRLQGFAIVVLCALGTGGLWYGLNLWRYGNPVAPFFAGARGTPFDAIIAGDFMRDYGGGRGLFAFVFAPVLIFLDSFNFGGRANLYNPLVYVGVFALFAAASRHRHRAPLFIAAVVYIGWFLTLQNARLLLPAAALLGPAAADCLMPLAMCRRSLRPVAYGIAAVSIGIVAVVGVVRATRYASDPEGFLERETQNYADIQWMNTHLDRGRDRVASDHKVLAYLEIPSIVLDPTYQLEISGSEINDDSTELIAACRRQGITYLFGNVDSFPTLAAYLRPVHQNRFSRLGGTRFFREPPTEATAVFEIVYDDAAAKLSRRSDQIGDVR